MVNILGKRRECITWYNNGMERTPEQKPERTDLRYPETFGIEPHTYEREIDPAVRELAGKLHAFQEETDEYQLPDDALETVRRLEHAYDTDDTQHEKKAHLYAMALEFLVEEMSHAWFKDCNIWRASAYDDYKNQTDLFLDIPSPDERDEGWVTVAIDVTSEYNAASKKVAEAMAEYRRGWLHSVDYFRPPTDEDTREPGRTFMPRMIVGASSKEVASLARAYGRYLHAGARNKAQEFDRLRFHPLAGEVYEELVRQAKVAHHMMRRNLLDEPNANETRREALKEHSKYLDKVHRALKERYQRWKNMAREHEKQARGLGRMPETPLNPVLQAVLRAG